MSSAYFSIAETVEEIAGFHPMSLMRRAHLAALLRRRTADGRRVSELLAGVRWEIGGGDLDLRRQGNCPRNFSINAG